MKFLHLFFSILAFLSCTKSHTQDLHWTMFDMSPLTLNPAMTGAFQGTYRIGGIYRSQWNTFVDGFTTPSFSVDSPVLMLGERSWLGVGGVITNDEAGTNQMTTFSAKGAVAVHLSLDQKSTSVLSFGIIGGMIQRRLNTDALLFEEQIVFGGSNNPFDNSVNGGLIGQNPRSQFLDFGFGVKLNRRLNKMSDMTIGFSFNHFTSPESSLLTGGDQYNLPVLFTSHGRFNTDLSAVWSLSAAMIFQRIASINEMGIQALWGYQLNKEKDITLRFGPGYRIIDNDAIEAILQFDYRYLKLGLAYDFNVSSLSSISNGQGGFEIAASYIVRIFKKPKITPSILCPRL